jgi:hypothetical protein
MYACVPACGLRRSPRETFSRVLTEEIIPLLGRTVCHPLWLMPEALNPGRDIEGLGIAMIITNML